MVKKIKHNVYMRSEWSVRRKKIFEAIIDTYGHEYFKNKCKSILEVGCSGIPISTLFLEEYPNIDITCSDAVKYYMDMINNEYPKIKTIISDLDECWPFEPIYDLIIHSGVLYHLKEPHTSLRQTCKSIKDYLFLETEWCDSDNPYLMICMVDKFEDIYNGAKNLIGCRPSLQMIHRVMDEENIKYKRIIVDKYNSEYHIYNNEVKNTNKISVRGKEYRGLWTCEKKEKYKL